MCDTARISGFLVAAKSAYLGALVSIGLALINSGNIFGAAATIGFVIAAAVLVAVSTGFYLAALGELDRCAESMCASQFADLRRVLIELLAAMAFLTGDLVGVLIIAWIPVLGSTAIAAIVILALPITIGVAALFESWFVTAVEQYNRCRSAASLDTIASAVVFLSTINAIVSIIIAAVIGLQLFGVLPFDVTSVLRR